jgi:hypothetical protein
LALAQKQIGFGQKGQVHKQPIVSRLGKLNHCFDTHQTVGQPSSSSQDVDPGQQRMAVCITKPLLGPMNGLFNLIQQLFAFVQPALGKPYPSHGLKSGAMTIALRWEGLERTLVTLGGLLKLAGQV